MIRYRLFEDPVDATRGNTLEGALRRALNTREGNARIGQRWAKRIRRDPLDNQEHMVANHVRDGRTYVFGNLVAYTLGRDQAVLVENQQAREADIRQLPAPARNQFVNSMVFWFVTDDHVLVAKHGLLNPPDLEVYFRWLLAERTTVCNPNLQVILSETITLPNALARHEEIRAIKIGGQIDARAPHADPENVAHRERRRVQRGGGLEFARRVLDLVVGNNDAAVERILREVPDDVELSVDVEIGFDSKKRKFSREALQRVAAATRNLPDSDVQVVTASGTLSGDELRLSHRARILLNGSLLDRDAVLEAMIDAYRQFVRTGKIDPSELEVADED